MNSVTMRDYVERWKAVNLVDIIEQRKASIELRWQQVNSIYLLASSMGIISEETTEDNEKIMRRWNKLKDLYK